MSKDKLTDKDYRQLIKLLTKVSYQMLEEEGWFAKVVVEKLIQWCQLGLEEY